MKDYKFVKHILLAVVSLVVWVLAGCRAGTEDGSPLSDEGRAAPSVAEQDKRGDQTSAPNAGASDLWVPGAGTALNMPKKDEVPYPAYPGAHGRGSGWIHSEQIRRIILITTDEPEDVLAFYKNSQEGWQFAETIYNSLKHYVLWDDASGSVDDAVMHYYIPAIVIREVTEFELTYMDDWLPGGVRTVFEVSFFGN